MTTIVILGVLAHLLVACLFLIALQRRVPMTKQEEEIHRRDMEENYREPTDFDYKVTEEDVKSTQWGKHEN